MRWPFFSRFVAALAGLLMIVPAAHAQFAVIDIASLTQLISEVQTLEQQVATARGQLTQAQQEYQSITGARGMEQLLAGTVRNYLPTSWTTLQTLAQSAGYPALTGDFRSALAGATVLSPGQLALLAPSASAQLQAARQPPALLHSVSQEALANSSGRFAALQQLIDAIGTAGDQKAALDLQARIAAEVGMLENEHTKLEVLYQGLQAQQWSNAQRSRELAIAGHGVFANRFQPSP